MGKGLCLLSQRFRHLPIARLGIAGADMILHSLFIFSLVNNRRCVRLSRPIWRHWTCFCGMSPHAQPLSVRLKSWRSTLTVRLHNPPKPQLSSDNLFDQRSEISPAHAIPRSKELVVVYFLICLSVDYKPMLSSYSYPNNLKFVHACLN